jgi:hypothetical protein
LTIGRAFALPIRRLHCLSAQEAAGTTIAELHLKLRDIEGGFAIVEETQTGFTIEFV